MGHYNAWRQRGPPPLHPDPPQEATSPTPQEEWAANPGTECLGTSATATSAHDPFPPLQMVYTSCKGCTCV